MAGTAISRPKGRSVVTGSDTELCRLPTGLPFRVGPLELGPNGLHSTGASLLPKLRDHFAEFLNEGSSDRLSILYLPTCVGFGTGTRHLPRRFSRRHGFRNFTPMKGLGVPSQA